jgi:hypothetical protein
MGLGRTLIELGLEFKDVDKGADQVEKILGRLVGISERSLNGLNRIFNVTEKTILNLEKVYGQAANNIAKSVNQNIAMGSAQEKEIAKFINFLSSIKLPDEFVSRLPAALQEVIKHMQTLNAFSSKDVIRLLKPEDIQNLQRVISLLEQFNREQVKIQQTASQTSFKQLFGGFFDEQKQKGVEGILGKTQEQVSKTGGALSGLLGPISKIFPAFAAAFAIERIVRSAINVIKDAVKAAIDFFDTMAKGRAVFMSVGREAATADFGAEQMERVMQLARETQTSFEDLVGAASEFAPILAGKGLPVEQLDELLAIMTRLGTLNLGPMGGVRGAQISIADALSEDFMSLKRRFNIDIADLREIMETEGVSMIEALSIYLDRAGKSLTDVAATSQTFQMQLKRMGEAGSYLVFQVLDPLLTKTVGFISKISEGTYKVGDFIGMFNEGTRYGKLLGDQLLFLLDIMGDLIGFATEGGIFQPIQMFVDKIIKDTLGGLIAGIAEIFNFKNPIDAALKILIAIVSGIAFAANLVKVVLIALRLAVNEAVVGLLTAIKKVIELVAPEKTAGIEKALAAAQENSEKIKQDLAEAAQAGLDILANFQEAKDRLNEFEWKLPEPESEDFELDMPAEEVEKFTDEMVESFIKFREEEADLNEDYEKERLDLTDDYNKENLERIADYELKKQRLIEDSEDKIADMRRDAQDKILEIEEGRGGEEAKFVNKFYEDRKLKIIKFEQDIEELEREHNERIRRIKEDHQSALEDAAANLDARAVAKANEKFQDDIRRENEEFAQKKAKLEAKLQEEINIETAANQEKLRIAREHDAQTIAEIQATLAKEEALELEDRNKRLKRMEEDFAIEQERRAQEFEAKLLEMELEHELELEELRKRFTQELLEQQKHNLEILGIQREGLDRVRQELEQWWNDNAELYLPPDFEVVDNDTDTQSTGTSGGVQPKGGETKKFQSGGVFGSTGLALGHAGEQVVTAPATKRIAGLLQGFDEDAVIAALQRPPVQSAGENSTSIVVEVENISIGEGVNSMSEAQIRGLVIDGITEVLEGFSDE